MSIRTKRARSARARTAAARCESPETACASSIDEHVPGVAARASVSTVGCFAKSSDTIRQPRTDPGRTVGGYVARERREPGRVDDLGGDARGGVAARRATDRGVPPVSAPARARQDCGAASSAIARPAASVLPRPTSSATSSRTPRPTRQRDRRHELMRPRHARSLPTAQASGMSGQTPSSAATTCRSRRREARRHRSATAIGVDRDRTA